PRASQSSAGLPPCSAARYFAISSIVEFCAHAAAASAIPDATTARRAYARRDILILASEVSSRTTSLPSAVLRGRVAVARRSHGLDVRGTTQGVRSWPRRFA